MTASEIARLGMKLRQERDIEIARAVSDRGDGILSFISVSSKLLYWR